MRLRYVARVRDDGSIRIHRDDQSEPVAVVTMPPGVGLREALGAAGWRPTGRRTHDGDWSSIYVERIARAAPELGSASLGGRRDGLGDAGRR